MSGESEETWADLAALLADRIELFLNGLDEISDKEDLLKFLRIDLDPDSFLDYADAEMVILITEVMRFLHGDQLWKAYISNRVFWFQTSEAELDSRLATSSP